MKTPATLSPTRLTLVAAIALSSTFGFAQRDDEIREPSALSLRAATEQPHLLSTQLGIGWFGLLRGSNVETTVTIDGDERNYMSRVTGTPATSLAYDYRLTARISLGAIASYQSLRFHDFRDANRSLDPNAELRINRTLIGSRVLFHYGPSERFELYSGLRAGLTVWGVSARNFGNDQIEDIQGLARVTAGVTPQFTIIPFGFRGHLTPQLNLGAELGWGSPHIAAVQVGYRF